MSSNTQVSGTASLSTSYLVPTFFSFCKNWPFNIFKKFDIIQHFSNNKVSQTNFRRKSFTRSI